MLGHLYHKRKNCRLTVLTGMVGIVYTNIYKNFAQHHPIHSFFYTNAGLCKKNLVKVEGKYTTNQNYYI